MNGCDRCMARTLGVVGIALALGGSASAQDSVESTPVVRAKQSSLRKIFGKSEGSSTSDAKGQPGDDLFAYAGVLYQKKYYDLAADKYKRYTQEFPEGHHSEVSHYRLAECYLNLAFPESAIPQYKVLIESFPNGAYTGPAAYRVATLAYNSEDYETAIPYFKIAADNAKKQELGIASHYYLARCSELSKQNEKAQEVYAMVLAGYPQSIFAPQAALRLGNLARSNKEFKKALSYYDIVTSFKLSDENQGRAEKLKETTRECLYQKALCLRQLGEEDAVAILRTLVVEPTVDDEWKKKAHEELKSIRRIRRAEETEKP